RLSVLFGRGHRGGGRRRHKHRKWLMLEGPDLDTLIFDRAANQYGRYHVCIQSCAGQIDQDRGGLASGHDRQGPMTRACAWNPGLACSAKGDILDDRTNAGEKIDGWTIR